MRRTLYTDDKSTKERMQANDNKQARLVAQFGGALVVIALIIVILFH
jgi:hypothetical protein